jgi:hypothetical protein
MDGLTGGVTSGARGVAKGHGRRDNVIKGGQPPARVGASRRDAPSRCIDP